MAKKYLSLKKAAELLGIQNSELVRLREKGQIRGFADRGTWKFNLDDLEEFNRRQQADSDPDVPILADSDVDLSEDSSSVLSSDEDEEGAGEGSTSIRSDLHLEQVDDDLIGASDSDVRLILDEDLVADAGNSDSDVKLDESGISLAAESGVSLQAPDDSGISLEQPESGRPLAKDDSGLSLAGEDSGLTLAEADSGLSLEDAAADSGIALEGGTDETELDVPAVDSQESEFELGLDDAGLDSFSDPSVLLFDDEDDADGVPPTAVQKTADADDESFDLEETTEEDFLESPEFDDELEVTDDVVGEDDELDELDVFDADDEVFEQALETGESHADFITPGTGRISASVEADWGTPMFVGLACSTVLMTLCSIMMFDLVRSMWGWHDPNPLSNGLVEVFSSLFG